MLLIGTCFILAVSHLQQPSVERTTKKTFDPPRIDGPVQFEASKTVAEGVPNTVVFTYDLSHVEADSFYIQQSWNPNNRFAIDPAGNAVTSIYYESGFHRARLIANDSVIARQPIHIVSSGWESHLYYRDAVSPIDLQNETQILDGKLIIDSTLLVERGIDLSRRFSTRITNSQPFEVHSDNFKLSSRLRVDVIHNKMCAWMGLLIVTEVHIFSVILQDLGCEKHVSYKLGEISKNGSNHDLSSLGCDVSSWQDLEILVQDKHASILLNGEVTYDEIFAEDLGMIKGLVYVFDGMGSIAYTKLEGSQGQTAFEDTFNQ